jgi:methionyl-tRNA formyltransferase
MLLQEKEPIHDDDTAGTLSERLRHKGRRLVLRTVQMIEAGNYTPPRSRLRQPLRRLPSCTRKCARSTGTSPAKRYGNFIRGLSPLSPAAWTRLGDKICKFTWPTSPTTLIPPPRAVPHDGKSLLAFRTADGWLAIDELQLKAEKR